MTDYEKLLEEADRAYAGPECPTCGGELRGAHRPVLSHDDNVCRRCSAGDVVVLAAALREVMDERDSEKRRADGAEAALSLQTERVIRSEAKLDASWSSARERLLHGLYHIRDMECAEDHDETMAPCPRRAAKEAIDNRPCSICEPSANGDDHADA